MIARCPGEVTTLFLDPLVVVPIFERGIKTDNYDTDKFRSVNILDTRHAIKTLANNIPAGQGVVQYDNQPYPVYGWLEVTHVPPTMHS
jgi:hypothetical protein